MNNNPPPAAGQQPTPSMQPVAGVAGTSAVPAAVIPGAVMPPPMAMAPAAVTIQQQQQHYINLHMQYNAFLSQGKITAEFLNANPQMMQVHLMRQQATLQAQAAARAQAAAAAAAPATTGASAGSGKGAGGKQTGLPSSMPNNTTAAAYASRKRKAEYHRLPDHPWDFFPESPLFVSLQDAERRIDAALNRKMAVLTDLAASQKLVVEGRAVGDTPGSARKRLRIYIFSKHYNQKDPLAPQTEPVYPNYASLSREVPGGRLDTDVKEPPSWSLHINGRVLDPDACHPGGGGDPEPPEDARITRHRFTYYLKRLEVRLDGEDGPLPNGVVVWQKHKMDHEARNAFEIKRQGSKPVKATITLEMDYQPEFYTVPAALETLIGLQTGEGGVPGIYIISHIASKIWSYCRTHGLVRNTLDGPVLAPNEALLNALTNTSTTSNGGDAALNSETSTFDAEQMQALIKKVLGKPHPLIIQHDIAVDGHDFSTITCLDLHLEVPLEFAGAKEFEPVVSASDALDKQLEQLDNSLAACWHRFKEHKRRRTFLTAFSEDPVGCIREIVMAQGKELRIAAGKEYEAIEVMRSADLYGDKWTQDAILKYISKKQAGLVGGGAPQLLATAATQAQVQAQTQAAMAAQFQMAQAQARQQAYQQALLQQGQQVAVPLNQPGVPVAAVVAPAAAAMASAQKPQQ
jgi:SWI/SNF-related matrix-associated actin-dependent regulator of chromatin subfamily D